ncbi:hypothetical protein QUB62_25135 [Microcoleus sp. A2-D3]
MSRVPSELRQKHPILALAMVKTYSQMLKEEGRRKKKIAISRNSFSN